jgi:hypothetical protein
MTHESSFELIYERCMPTRDAIDEFRTKQMICHPAEISFDHVLENTDSNVSARLSGRSSVWSHELLSSLIRRADKDMCAVRKGLAPCLRMYRR